MYRPVARLWCKIDATSDRGLACKFHVDDKWIMHRLEWDVFPERSTDRLLYWASAEWLGEDWTIELIRGGHTTWWSDLSQTNKQTLLFIQQRGLYTEWCVTYAWDRQFSKNTSIIKTKRLLKKCAFYALWWANAPHLRCRCPPEVITATESCSVPRDSTRHRHATLS